MPESIPKLVPTLLFALICVSTGTYAQQPLTLNVDAREATRNLVHVRETLPARPGKLTLVYPKWIPGEHGPTGPINGVVNLKLSADGKPLTWQRDPIDMFAIHCDVPPGTRTVEAAFDHVSEPGTIATANLARVKWNRLLLYPAGSGGDSLRVQAGLRLPTGWQFGTALPIASQSEAQTTIEFQPVSLHTLIDSPVLAGRYFRRIPLRTGTTPAHEIDLAAESQAELTMPPEMLAGYNRLVGEAGALFGARHYGAYHWLLTLSDQGGSDGLEHHESSEDGVGEKAFTETADRLDLADLLSHEYVHSWNGKYRRPVGLATPDYQTPMQGDLLWVYEGLTQYLGTILPARSGLWTPEEFRDTLASVAANMDNTPGRQWRPLSDTAVAAQLLYSAPPAWSQDRRGVDYYFEGTLIWLEVDSLLRQQTQNKKSLDDFCQAFHGGQSGPPTVKTYTLDGKEGVIETLNRVAPYDWAGFFRDRVYSVQPHAPLGGITNDGWKLVYNDTSNERDKGPGDKGLSLPYSLGLRLDDDGKITMLVSGLSGAQAGLAPGMKIVAVNGRKYSSDRLKDAVKATSAGGVLDLLVDDNEFIKTFRLAYTGGARFPHLIRDDTKPDLLAAVIAPHNPTTPAPKP